MRSEELRAFAMLVGVLAPPVVAVFRHQGHGLRLTERFLLALALGPLALALPALALALLVHLPLKWCLWQSEFLWAVAALWPRTPQAPQAAPSEPLPERGQGFPSVAALATALGAAVLVAAVSLSVPLVQMWSDAWFHGAAATEVAIRGVPPQDPNFAGVPLYDGWLFHFVVSLLAVATGFSVFDQMAMVNVWAVVVLVLAAGQLTYRAFGRGAAMWVGVIALLGLDPLGWVFWIVRGAGGEHGGLSPLIALLGTADDAAIALSYKFPPAHVSLLDRFWTGTALPPAIALGVASAWSVARTLERPSAGAWLRTLVLALALCAIHPEYAAFAVAGLALGLVLPGITGERRGARLALLAALGLAFAAAIAYARGYSVPGATTAVRLGFNPGNLWSLVLAVGPWWIVLAPALADAWRRGAAGRFAAATAAVTAGAALVVVLPGAGSDRLFDLAWVSLVPLVAAGVVWWGDRLRLPAVARLALVIALVVPTSGLYTIATARDPRSPGVLIRGDEPATRRLPLATAAEADAYLFMREHLPRDAVVIEKPRPTVNEPVPVLAERRVFCGSLDVYLSSHFGERPARGRALQALREEFQVRRGIQLALFEDGELDETQRLYLAEFSAPLYLLVRRNEVADPVWEGFRGRLEWTEEFSNEETRLYQFRGRPSFGEGSAASGGLRGPGAAA